MADKQMGSSETYEVVLLDDSGEESRFEHVLTFMHDNGRYVALSPIDGNGEQESDDASDDETEAEIVILKVEEKDGEDTYVSIDNEVLLEEAFDTFLGLMDELEEDS